MKIETITVAAAIFLTGCRDQQPPPVNDRNNDVTMRQKLVEQFHTAEVVPLPYANHEFIVRDTNGAVWYSRTDATDNAGTAMLMPGNAPVPPTARVWIMPQVLPPSDVLSNLIASVRAENEGIRQQVESLTASNLVLTSKFIMLAELNGAMSQTISNQDAAITAVRKWLRQGNPQKLPEDPDK